MGEDKARLPWPVASATTTSWDRATASVSFLQRSAAVLSGFCAKVEVASGSGDSSLGPWPSFADAQPASPAEGERPGKAGPLAGLVAALERSQALGLDGAVVLACDMPLVERAEFEPLLEELRAGADAAMWTIEDEDGLSVDQPLVAVYGARVLPAARAAFDGGARRLVAIAQFPAADGRHLRVERVPATENSSRRLVNVNTPSDYHSAVDAYLSREPRHRDGVP